MKTSVWAVIAAKNEEMHIREVVTEVKRHVDHVLVVNDGSTDSTTALAKKAKAEVLEHVVNLGKGAAIKTGCEYALSHGAKIIVLLDADGQHEPKEIPNFIQHLKRHDIVFGVRTQRKSMPLVLKLGNEFITKVTQLLYGINIKDTQSGYRAFRAGIYPKIKWHSSGYSMESEMIANVGNKKLKYVQIPISTIYANKYKGTTILDGIKIVFDMIWWKITR
jgi:glycosyltransferase involved in cell wall biosynthesis